MRHGKASFWRQRAAKLNETSARRLFEPLETRAMLSANAVGVDLSTDALSALDNAAAETEVTPLASSSSTVLGYTPAEIASAYGFSNISFGSVKGNRRGPDDRHRRCL